MAGEGGYGDAVYRTGKSVGERLLRKLQREVAGRVLEWRDFLLAERGAGGDREVAHRVQHKAPSLGARLQAACPGGL